LGEPDLFLHPEVILEPLVDRWYAWSHLISPATAALNIVRRHLKIMDSYVQAPMVHAAAVRNPAMIGGPFLDCGGKRVEEVRSLVAQTRRDRSQLLRLSEALIALSQLLEQHTTGETLEPLYADIPDELRGYVELVYDLNHRPSFRLLEALLYQSPYMDDSAQSIVLRRAPGQRPFVGSTPRLDAPDQLHLTWPLADPRIDTLARLRHVGRPKSELLAELGLDADEEALFLSFLTPERSARHTPPAAARCRYLGHACLLFETPETAVLVDPFINHGTGEESFTYADLPPYIDTVLVTHNHKDHMPLETLLELRHRVGTIVVPRSSGGALQDPSLALMLRHVGFENVVQVDDLDVLRSGDVTITAVPFLGEHGDLDIRSKSAYALRIGDFTALLAADSRNVEPKTYTHLRRVLGPIDTLFLGMECDGAPVSWVYGPLFPGGIQRRQDQHRRLAGSDCVRGVAMAEALGCRAAYVYAMGLEPWLSYIIATNYTPDSHPIVQANALVAHFQDQGLQAELLRSRREWTDLV